MALRAPKGTDDVLPPVSRRWRWLLRLWDELTERYGYELVMTPVFELTEVFARGVGEATEVVEKQMYTFEDKAGRSLTLRPENTAGVVRAYIQDGRSGVFKGAYSGAMFRYEQPQQGRRRQFWQLGVEYIGEEAVEADLEVIEVGYRYLHAAGLRDVEVLVNSIGDPADRAAYIDILRVYLESKRAQLSVDAQRRIATNPLRVLDSKPDVEVLADAPTPVEHLSAETKQHFELLLAGLDERRIPYVIEPGLVRGLDYYNRTVFEYVPRSYEAAQSAVGGGGRYDGLAELLGGPHVPSTGLALGLDRILAALGEQPALPALDAFVVVAAPERRPAAQQLIHQLRERGLRVDSVASDRSVKAQFRAADRRDASAVVLVGDEWDQGLVKLKMLQTGEEEQVPVADVPARLEKI